MAACQTAQTPVVIEERPRYPDSILVPPPMPAKPTVYSDVAAAFYIDELEDYGLELRERLRIIRCLEDRQDPVNCRSESSRTDHQAESD